MQKSLKISFRFMQIYVKIKLQNVENYEKKVADYRNFQITVDEDMVDLNIDRRNLQFLVRGQVKKKN